MKIKRITTRDIAKELGLHYTTVAEALRNSPRISEKTRKRVSEAAAEMGYRPDPMLSALNAYRCDKKIDRRAATLAWVNTHEFPDNDRIKFGFNFRCLEGATQRAHELGFKLVNFWLQNPRMSGQRASRILVARGIKGVVVPPLDESVKNLDFEWNNFAAVRLGRSFQDSNLPSVSPENSENTILLFRYLVRAGFRRIGFACPRWINQRVNCGFVAGYLGAHAEYLPDTEIAPLFQKDLNAETKAEFIEWIKAHKFEVLMLHRNDDYEGVLQEAGVRVPDDLSLAWTSLHRRSSSRCGIYENGETIGRHGVDLVMAMMNRGEFGHDANQADLRVRGIFNMGTTVKPLKPVKMEEFNLFT